MPPIAMFDAAHRPDRLVMPACGICNDGTRTADLTASIVSRWGYDEQVNEDHANLIKRARKQAHQLVKEWSEPINPMEARLHLEMQGVAVPPVAAFVTIGPETIRQLNLFSHKAVLCLHFEHFKRGLTNNGRVAAYWRTKEDFAKEGIPKTLLQMMREYGTLEQGRWNVREQFEYRYSINEDEGLFACLARFRDNLFVTGFTAPTAAVAKEVDANWLRPCDLLDVANSEAFLHRD